MLVDTIVLQRYSVVEALCTYSKLVPHRHREYLLQLCGIARPPGFSEILELYFSKKNDFNFCYPRRYVA